MKKLIRVFLLTLICFFITDNMSALSVKAAEQSELSGVGISISSDKEKYNADENGQISFTISNTNSNDISNLEWNLKIPDDLTVKSGELSGKDITLAAGESITGTIAAAKKIAAAENVATTSVTKNVTITSSPNTGDDRSLVLLLSVMGSVVVIAFASKKRNIFTKSLCILLCMTCAAAFDPVDAFLAAAQRVTANAVKTITVDDTQYSIVLNVSFDEFDNGQDSDNDGLTDSYEYNILQTDPLLADSDENGTPDGEEDNEGDGLSNAQEYTYSTNPFSGDTDNDGFPDGYEASNGMDPLTFNDIVIDDSIASAMSDYTEYDLEVLNNTEKYPLEIYNNENGKVERINGVYSENSIYSVQDALYSLYNIKTLLGIEDPESELKFNKAVFTSASTSYSFIQTYNGVEVSGRNIIITCRKDGSIVSVYSSYINRDKFEGIDTVPAVTEDQLKSIAEKEAGKEVKVISSKLVIEDDEEPVLVYGVLTGESDLYRIDAHTGKVLSVENNYGVSFFDGGDITAIDENGDEQTIKEGAYFDYYNGYEKKAYMCDMSKKLYVVDWGQKPINKNYESMEKMLEAGVFPYIKDTVAYDGNKLTWDETSVSAYINLRFAYERYRTLDPSYTGIDGKGGRAVLFTHAVGKYDNGMKITDNSRYEEKPYDYIMVYNASGYTLDENGNKKYITKASDKGTICHEYGHAIFHHKSNVDFESFTDPESDAERFVKTVNEAYADIFSCCANATWMQDSHPGRNIPDPHASFNPLFVGDVKEFLLYDSSGFPLIDTSSILPKQKTIIAYDPDFKEPHQNSTIISHAAYLLNTKYNYSFNQIYALFYGSLPQIGNWVCGFDQIESSLISSARALNYTEEQISGIYQAFKEVGVEPVKAGTQLWIMEGGNPLSNVDVTLTNYINETTLTTDSDGYVKFDDLPIGTYGVKISLPGREPIYAANINVHMIANWPMVIDILSAGTEYNWDHYDHFYYPENYGSTLKKHIEISDTDIKMTGYTEAGFKDFLLTHENDDPNSFVHCNHKTILFNLGRDDADWHSMEGGGLLFDVSITDATAESNSKMTAHCLLITSDGLKLYSLNDIDMVDFKNGKLGNISNIGTELGSWYYDSGSVMEDHSFSIDIDKWHKENLSIWDGDKLIVDNIELADKLAGDDYGPITSHSAHCCSQVSWFNFSDIYMVHTYLKDIF